MPASETPVVKRSLFSWIISANLKLQALLVGIVVVAVFARVVPLEMQKRIVNEAIEEGDFDLLVTYCGIYLLAFVTASGLKFLINVLQTVISQRTLAEMRKRLFDHILHLPYPVFRKTQPGLVVSALLTELASASDFIGMAVAIPVTNLLTLLAFAGYLFWLDPLLAAVSFSIYPAVLILIPRLQKQVDRYNSKRVDAGRALSGKIGESVEGIHEIKINGAYRIENRRFGGLADRIKDVRIRWKFYRFAVKVVNNLFTNFSRFLIFALGGYMALRGNLELGALVAFLSAQEKLYDPWKELLNFYQALRTARVTYRRTMDYFDIPAEPFYGPEDGAPETLKGAVEVDGLTFTTEDDQTLIREASFSLEPGEHMALVGFSGSGKSTLAHCLVRLIPHSGGKVLLDGEPIGDLAPRSVVANVGFVSQEPLVFQGTVEENLLYACAAVSEEGERPERDDRIAALQQVGLYVDVLNMAHQQTLETEGREGLKEEILRVRRRLHKESGGELADDIERFDGDRFLEQGSVAENIRFGCPCDDRYRDDRMAEAPELIAVLHRAGLYETLLETGADLAEEILDIFGSMPAEAVTAHGVPMEPDEMEIYRQVVERRRREGGGTPAEGDRRRLLALALRYVPSRHKVLTLSEAFRDSVLRARKVFRERLEQTAPGAVAFYDENAYAEGLPILNNIVFGRLTGDSSRVRNRVYRNVNRLLVEEEFLEQMIEIGMQFEVGSGGENLSGGQRQKLAIARALLKNPSILIMDEATSNLDNQSQARVQDMLVSRWKGKSTLVSVIHRLDIIEDYDKIGVMKAGRLVETGTYDELMEQKGALYELAGGAR